MLVLSRQRDQTIVIGENIEVTVLDVRGDKVRIGITAPKTVSVHRKEIFMEIQKSKDSPDANGGDKNGKPGTE